jgi:signal transduction histidine kinase
LLCEEFISDMVKPLPVLRSSRASLESVDVNAAVIQNLPNTAIIVFDDDLCCVSAQGALLDRLRISPVTAFRRRLNAVLPAESTAQLDPRCRAAIEGIESALELRLSSFTYRIDVLPLKNADRQIVAGMLIWRDITEYAQRQAEEVGTSNLSALRGFVRDFSHDYRTSLAIISSSAYLLEKFTEPLRRLQYRERITSQVNRLVKMVEKLLMLVRLESEERLAYAPIAVNEFVKEAVIKAEKSTHDKELQWQFDLEQHPLIMHGDEDVLDHCFSQILENAMQFTPHGGQILIRTRALANALCIEVIDTGIGIPENELPRIFEPFYRVDQARSTQTGGSGLGLTIAKRAMRVHGGTLVATSKQGHGTTLRMLLPTQPVIYRF